MNTDPMIQPPIPSTRRSALHGPQRAQRTQRHAPLLVTHAGATDRGRERENNEDHMLRAPVGERGLVLAVADGMGGARGGETASAIAIGAVEDLLVPALTAEAPDDRAAIFELLRRVVGRADSRVISRAMAHAELEGMGTTLTVAYSAGRDLFVGHVGDSRCYLLQRGVLRALTSDHTLAGDLARCGVISVERAAEHGMRHVLTNVVGASASPPQIELHHVELGAGDVVLLCSDGLSEMLPDESIAAILASATDPSRAVEALIARANDLGGRDNVTAVVARYEAP